MSSKADPTRMAYIGKVPFLPGGPEAARDSDAWFTPPSMVERARRALGGRIDLDPFSCAEANKAVGAVRFFSEGDSALGRRWSECGQVTVFMNPPYGRGIMQKAVDQFLSVYYGGQISRAVVLVNNATETAWFQALAEASDAICLVNRRIAFYNTDGKEASGNTRGQVFLYFDVRGVETFVEAFKSTGRVFTNGAQ